MTVPGELDRLLATPDSWRQRDSLTWTAYDWDLDVENVQLPRRLKRAHFPHRENRILIPFRCVLVMRSCCGPDRSNFGCLERERKRR